MLHRRTLLAASATLLAAPAAAQPAARRESKPASTFMPFVEGLKVEARKNGIKEATIERAFRGIKAPNMKVIELDRRQPEFTLTWDQYRAKVISDARIARGKEHFRNNKALIEAICTRYKLSPGPLLGIWGLESNYGQFTGGFNVIESLATLAWEGRRATFFRVQLTHALKILDAGDIPPERMLGSYAGAMGQPQFMPDSFTRLAVDWDRDGKRDLWGSNGDILGSIANYLAKSGWKPPLGWGQRIRIPNGFDATLAGREKRRVMAEWTGLGLKLADPPPPETQCAVLLPDGPEGNAFLVYHPNFQAIRRYNPSDFYALAVGLIGDAVVG
jgi:membrane-bound lytic murein transglycosylase B